MSEWLSGGTGKKGLSQVWQNIVFFITKGIWPEKYWQIFRITKTGYNIVSILETEWYFIIRNLLMVL